MLEHLKEHLKEKAVILGIGNTLRSDDGAGSILANRIKDKVPWVVYDAAESPENFLNKIIALKPKTLVIIDAADFGKEAGELQELEGSNLKTTNLFSTHNSSLSLVINYLQNNLKIDIIILMIQPKTVAFGDKLSPEVSLTLKRLEDWFLNFGKD